jgi:hypothetical protein
MLDTSSWYIYVLVVRSGCVEKKVVQNSTNYALLKNRACIEACIDKALAVEVTVIRHLDLVLPHAKGPVIVLRVVVDVALDQLVLRALPDPWTTVTNRVCCSFAGPIGRWPCRLQSLCLFADKTCV